MTEAEWTACAEQSPLLVHLRGKASTRKLRLFACANCLEYWPSHSASFLLDAYYIAERFADGLVSEIERSTTFQQVVRYSLDRYSQVRRGQEHTLAIRDTQYMFALTVGFAIGSHSGDIEAHITSARDDPIVRARKPTNLRDIFGNPFSPLTFDPNWRTTTALALARGIYDNRDFSTMSILADALQDAGCENEDILNHLREPNATHVRGCWALDLVLGKS